MVAGLGGDRDHPGQRDQDEQRPPHHEPSSLPGTYVCRSGVLPIGEPCRSVGDYAIGKVVVIVPRVRWLLDQPGSVHCQTVRVNAVAGKYVSQASGGSMQSNGGI